jgi:hypothetical protein
MQQNGCEPTNPLAEGSPLRDFFSNVAPAPKTARPGHACYSICDSLCFSRDRVLQRGTPRRLCVVIRILVQLKLMTETDSAGK